LAGCITFDCQPLLVDFVTDNAANDSATKGSGGTAAGQHGTTNGADTGADGSILSLRRHARTAAQTEYGSHDSGIQRHSLQDFHGITSS
jgi:hypothetical protein